MAETDNIEADRYKSRKNTKDQLVAAVTEVAPYLTYPVQVTIDSISHATLEQNRMQFQWFKDAAEQSKESGDPEQITPEYWRGICKAYCGVPILLRDDEDFRARYEKVVKPLDAEVKLELMREPFDFPITRLMNKEQKSEYLEAVKDRLTNRHGFTLTEPKA